jgi:hypothetical protein
VITLNAKLVQSFGWLAVQIRTATPRLHQPSQAVLRSVLTRHKALKDTNNTAVFYVGVGDRFDDERRLVRESTSEFRPAHPAT